jgi:hypothetical protein
MSVAYRHLPDLFSLFLAILFFLVGSDFFITEKSMLSKLYATGTGFAAGMVGGGILGWIVGGVGIVAMGTGIGVGSLGIVLVGGAVGAVLGTLTGASFSFFQMLSNPGDFNLNLPGLALVLIGSAIVFFGVRWLLRRMAGLSRKRPPAKI